ncbi:MAG: ABC transporter substrate-binding protein [Bacteroidota bacterium]
MKYFIPLLAFFLLMGCGQKEAEENEAQVLDLSWSEIEAKAKGRTVNLMMWQGDPFINDYIQSYVVPEVRNRYGVTLKVANGQGNQIVSILLAEQEAGKQDSELDMMWINGETFFQLRQIDALFGPFVEKLPNSAYIDFENPFIKYDFQQESEGYESPWGSVQQALIYDSARVDNPPTDMASLESWVVAHPGKFTFPNDFTGMSFLKALLVELAGDADRLSGPFDETLYEELSTELWVYLNRIKGKFWKQGETFPAATANLHQLYASGEVDITMSMNDAEVDNKVLQGAFPTTSRAYVLSNGTIRNTHFMGIAKGARDKAGALVTINFLLEPEAQWKKAQPAIWGDGSVLDMEKLPPAWKKRFESIPQREHAPKRSEIEPLGLSEPAPEYMIHLFDDFRKYVIQQ